jgi:predicted alpha/beta hydrolase family esterase
MCDFLVRVDVPQCTDLKSVVVNGIGLVAVVDVTEITLHEETLLTVDPEYVITVPGRVLSAEGADDFACRYEGIGKQALAMDRAVSNINSIIGHLAFSFVLTGVDCTLRALDVTGE